eukprot:10578355-Alexandrium_andersonii.AAC.1
MCHDGTGPHGAEIAPPPAGPGRALWRRDDESGRLGAPSGDPGGVRRPAEPAALECLASRAR